MIKAKFEKKCYTKTKLGTRLLNSTYSYSKTYFSISYSICNSHLLIKHLLKA